jgi:phytanoyl-CoA hydroxylase
MTVQTEMRIEGDLENDGFCVLKDVFSNDSLSPKRELVHDIIEYRESGFADPLTGPHTEYLDHRVDQGVLYDVFWRYPGLQDMARNKRILDGVESVIGPNIYLYVTSIVYKPPEGRNEVPLHQDFLGRENESDRYIAWMPLYDATRENGCLKAIPGTHKNGFRDFYTVEGETHHKRLEESEYSEEDVEYLEMEAGDVLLFHHQLIHGSDEVTADDPRHAYRAVYKAPSEDDIALPRGSPLMLRGGDPESLKQTGQDIKIEEICDDDRTFVKRKLHGLGKKLQNL